MSENEQSSKTSEIESPFKITNELLNRIQKMEDQNSTFKTSIIDQNEVNMKLTKRIENTERLCQTYSTSIKTLTTDFSEYGDYIRLLHGYIKALEEVTAGLTCGFTKAVHQLTRINDQVTKLTDVFDESIEYSSDQDQNIKTLDRNMTKLNVE